MESRSLRNDLLILSEEHVVKLSTEEQSVTLNSELFSNCETAEFTNLDISFNHKLLMDECFLVETTPYEHESIKYNQHCWLEHLYPHQGAYKKVRESRVLIIGCGGTGSLIAQTLASSGVREFILVDGDTVKESNLNRQYAFSRKQLNSYKVDALSSYLVEEYDVSEPQCIRDMFLNLSLSNRITSDIDLIVCAADEPSGEIQILCAELALRKNAAIIFGAVGLTQATVGPLIKDPESIDGFIKINRSLNNLKQTILKRPTYPSNGSTNSIVANIIALNCLAYLGSEQCSLENRCYRFSFLELTSKLIYSLR
ncbi:ThiF family adenylyltransferase [Vibrio vulnificus]